MTQRAVQLITSDFLKAFQLSDLAKAAATTDPDRGLRLAMSVPDAEWKGKALIGVAKVLAAEDPGRGRLLNDVERSAQSISNVHSRGAVLYYLCRRCRTRTRTGPNASLTGPRSLR